MKNRKENIMNRRIKYIVILLICILCVPMFGAKAEAAKTCKSKIAYPATTIAQVNFRKKAGTKYKTYGMLKKNQSVTVLGWCTNGGMKWYKCKATINGKKKTGYVSAGYIQLKSKPTGYVNAKVTTKLNVRKKAKSSAKVLIKIPKDTKVSVRDVQYKSGNYWYKIKVTYKNKTKTGFVDATYIDITNKPSTSNDTNNSNKPTTDSQSPMEGYVNEKVSSKLNVRNAADVKSPILVSIPRNTVLSVLGTSGDWYNVEVVYEQKKYKGYVSKQYVTLGKRPDAESGDTDDSSSDSNSPGNSDSNDPSFEVLLSNFPESYKTALRALHNEYPNWRFVAVQTNLDWNTVIANESVVGRNVIQSNYPRGITSLAPFSYLSTEAGAYNWAKDEYVVKDGSNWYSANSAVISYYMDPRNFLNSTDIFQFESLAYDSSHSADVVKSILRNTFMSGKYDVYDYVEQKNVSGTYKKAFMDAGKTAAANPYFLAARVKQEVGVNVSNATSGTYKGYEGIYNFYNIGAFDGKNAVVKGLQWAKGGANGSTSFGRPWTTPYKSIVGGAQYIASQYINQGQNTLYLQKFNVKPNNLSDLYLHQYMTNVQAPYSEGRITRAAYNEMGILSDAMVFFIPVYNNMPNSVCQLPPATGNPNPYLSNVKLYFGEQEIEGLTPTFQYNQFEYTVVVPQNVSTVTVKATPVSRYASVSGTGAVNLSDPGTTTTITVVGTAQNGAVQTYTIHVTRNIQ